MKLINVARFNFPSDAVVLESILSAEKIHYSLVNEDGATLIPGTGVKISVLEKDRDKVIEIIKEAGYEKYLLPQK